MLEHLNAMPTMPKRVVVMGAGGFVGGSLVERLQLAGIPVLALTRKDVDLLQDGAAKKLAALIEPGDSFVAVSAMAPAKNADMMIDNMTLAWALVAALKERIKDISHVINISSDAVYSDTPTPLSESTCTGTDSYHGVMHLAREVMFRAEIEAPLAILRPTLIYGAKDPHNGYGPNQFRGLVNEGIEIKLFGEGEEQRDHVHIDDVAEIIYLSLINRSQGILNIATGNVASFREVAEMVVSHSENSVMIKGGPRSGPMPHNGYRPFDISACRAAFPEFHYMTLSEGVARSQIGC